MFRLSFPPIKNSLLNVSTIIDRFNRVEVTCPSYGDQGVYSPPGLRQNKIGNVSRNELY